MQLAQVNLASLEVLAQLAELDQAVLNAIPLGVYVCDADGHILRANAKAEELWGRGVALGSQAQRFCNCFRVETLAGDFIPPDATPMAQAVRYGASFDGVEARVENPDGRRWVASVTIKPLADRQGRVVGAINCFQDITREYDQREMLIRRQKSFDLAMTASKMGTWRYTMADNICLYDDNAQRLYGLTDGRFLHDDEGVKHKFHADDMSLMWSQVAKACDPKGEGLYDVEYRVRQLDGSWRWLSAWGYVEFEGEGDARKPVAITGASRDISEMVQATEAQKLLINELNHRVKNMLATVQSIARQTQRSTPDAFGVRFEERLMALSRAHDLLTRRQWAGVGSRELLEQALSPFASESDSAVRMDGPDHVLSAQAALSLAMVIHELATNAAKYGALSSPSGRIDLAWSIGSDGEAEALHLNWIEKDGPRVEEPTRRGFGARLIERSVGKDLGGKADMRFLPAGLQCELTMPLGAIERR
ncbi:MAG TPA: HWE histidine kinase domain-containing protein [Hyphomonadaceae bacterium]|nr:HWE histidine kinase domain-containing protein [Hyphomonadaceae bacterium]